MNKRRRYKAKQRRLIGRYAMHVQVCGECHGSGRLDNHVTGEVECGHCDGGGSEYTWHYAATLEWVLTGTFKTKSEYESYESYESAAGTVATAPAS